jgi:ubiquinone/menaquinone biosynthesis C-methylase UbiE
MKLHLGCGKKYLEGYVHVDVVNYPHIDYLCSIDDLRIFKDNSIELIYNCHVLEHFSRCKVPEVLQEWYRVLEPGGILRTAVPDFEACCEWYLTSKGIHDIIGLIMGRQDYLYNIHYNMFDYSSLRFLLRAAGFKDVYRYDWKQVMPKGFDDYSQAYLPHMDKDNGKLMSLNLEAIK